MCVMPRNRLEDAEFREWIQTHKPDWAPVRDRPNPRRRERIARATGAFTDLNAKLCAPRAHRRKRAEVEQRVEDILATCPAKKYFAIELYQGQEHQFRQANRGRPGPNTRYVRIALDEAAID